MAVNRASVEFRNVSRRYGKVAAVLAIGIGMGAAIVPGGSAEAAQSSPFAAGANLAPSTLLANIG